MVICKFHDFPILLILIMSWASCDDNKIHEQINKNNDYKNFKWEHILYNNLIK